MGGMGSGRWGGAPTKEATGAIVLDVHSLMRAARRSDAWGGFMTVAVGGGEPQRIAMAAKVDREAGTGTLRLQFDVQHLSHRTGPQDQTIMLRSMVCHFGARRWTFLCPIRRCWATRLYLPNGGDVFAGRHAYRMGYQSQRGSRTDRAWRVIRRVDARLGHDGNGDWIAKPKWMRWRTFNRLCDRRDAAEGVLDGDLMRSLERLGKYLPDHA